MISCYELGHQPIGLAQPLGFLEQAGYSPAALDIAVEDFDPVAVRSARFIGLSVPMHTALRLGVHVARLIRDLHPTCHLCFYGLYASINAEYLLAQGADSVIGGEYELPMVRLVEALDAGADLDFIEGVSRPGRTVGPFLERPPAPFPVPTRTGLPLLDRYAHLEFNGSRHVVGYVEASRGCLHRCLHCPIVPVYEGRFFIFPEEAVLEDIRRQVGAGARHITFGDPDFLNGPGHSLSIVRKMHGEFPDITFDITTKIEHLLRHQSLIPEFASLGCIFVISAVESFSDVVLQRLRKGHTRTDVFAVLELLRAAGLALRPSLVAFTPWTTLDDYVEMFDLVGAHDLVDAIDPVQYTVRLLIPPGSALLAQSDCEPAPMRAFLSPLDEANFQYPWIHPDPRMDKLHKSVTAAVEEAARLDQDPARTFDHLRGLACETAGRTVSCSRSPRIDHRGLRNRLPRLSEPWFCCAEPTEGQFRPLQPKGST